MRLHDVMKTNVKTNANKQLLVLSDEQVKQLHSIFLMMLDDMKRICAEHGIKFILIGGCAIGAIRHHTMG